MSQTVSLCLTNTGNTTLSSTINIYSDYNTGWTLIDSNVPLSSITGNQCPYVLTAPDGTNNIRLIDNVSHCFVDINLMSTASCDTCHFGLKNYSATTVGTISSGILTGTCQANITEYLINWYGPNSTTTIAFSTGSGTTFPHQYNHPFSGVSSIPAQEGTYYPVLENVIISGYSFSNTGGTATGEILSLLDCLTPITVDAYRCDNTTNTNISYPYSAYNHHIQFSTTSQLTAQPVLVTFQISASTKFIVWAFKGENAPDRLKLSLSGQNYSTLIGLEDIWVGNLVPSNNFSTSSITKSALTQYFYNKITTLTGLTISNGDKIIIEVTPSTVNTNWDFYFTCKETYGCSDCLTNNDYFKIIGSSITGITGSCGVNMILFDVSGCTYYDFANSDYVKFYVNSYYSNPIGYYGFPNSSVSTAAYWYGISPNTSNITRPNNYSYSNYFPQTTCNYNTRYTTNHLCGTDTTTTYFQRSISTLGTGIYSITGSSAMISAYYNQWNYVKNNTLNGYLYNSNPTNLGYYGNIFINFPTSSTPDFCADPTSYDTYVLHPSSYIETGTTGGNYYLSITSVTISDLIGSGFTSCDLRCSASTNEAVYTVNLYATGNTTFIYSFPNSGFYFQNLVYLIQGITSGITNATSTPRYGGYRTLDFETNTYPFSGSPATLIPSFSASCCSNYFNGSIANWYGSVYRDNYKYFYTITLTNPLNQSDFDISGYTITNGVYSGPPILAYRYSGGSVVYTNPTFVI